MIARVARLSGGFALLATVTAAAASAVTPPPVPPLPIDPGGPNQPATTATLSSHRPGAKPVALTVTVHYEMICGQPGPGTAIVTLPTAVRVPSSIASSAVLVNGKPAPAVGVSGHDVSVALPRRKGITCDSIGPGALTLTLTKSAGLGNPASTGTYTIRVKHKTQSFRASVDISA